MAWACGYLMKGTLKVVEHGGKTELDSTRTWRMCRKSGLPWWCWAT